MSSILARHLGQICCLPWNFGSHFSHRQTCMHGIMIWVAGASIHMTHSFLGTSFLNDSNSDSLVSSSLNICRCSWSEILSFFRTAVRSVSSSAVIDLWSTHIFNTSLYHSMSCWWLWIGRAVGTLPGTTGCATTRPFIIGATLTGTLLPSFWSNESEAPRGALSVDKGALFFLFQKDHHGTRIGPLSSLGDVIGEVLLTRRTIDFFFPSLRQWSWIFPLRLSC